MDVLEFIKGITVGAEKIIFLCAIGLVFEYFRPAEKNQPAKTILFNIIWILNFVLISSLLMHYLGRVVAPVVETLDVARRARRLMVQNFALALGYNALAVPLAMAGLITPLYAAAAMSASSLVVTLNAFRLRWRRR